MLRVILLIVWLLLSAWLIVWTGEGLFGIDQRESILPFGGDSLGAPILIGVTWGILLAFGGTMLGLPRRRITHAGDAKIGVARIVEVSTTGTTINDVPEYDIFVRVTPTDGDDFVSQLRTLVPLSEAGALQVGQPLAVRYRDGARSAIELADPTDPAVREALLQWRIGRGLIDPRQVRARTTGTQVPASVLEIRPTGRRREGQSELALRVLLAPEGAETWEADTTVFVYPEAVGRLQVGAPIWAFYRREDPQTVAVTIEKEAGR
jgi:hypothetical protein